MTKTKKATKKTPPIQLNSWSLESSGVYAGAIIEACKRAKVDAIKVLTDSDEYPKIKKVDMIEFAIGWFHGCAEAHEVTVEALWQYLDNLGVIAKARAA